MELLKSLWIGVTPYLMLIIEDAIISMFLWLALWFFKLFTNLLNIEGWVSDLILNIHSAQTALAYLAFLIIFFIDIINLKLVKRG
ncbi:hypothetical protein RMQ50_004854 [Vibrio alginolyticus]|nr:hypothetical protein [Vibrio alginolyticus]